MLYGMRLDIVPGMCARSEFLFSHSRTLLIQLKDVKKQSQSFPFFEILQYFGSVIKLSLVVLSLYLPTILCKNEYGDPHILLHCFGFDIIITKWTKFPKILNTPSFSVESV